jgi:outer membrane protein OmpA-like peptidoglycan-associated protein
MPLTKNGTVETGESAQADTATKAPPPKTAPAKTEPVKPQPSQLPTEGGLSRTAKIGAFLLSGLVLFGLGLFLIGDRQKVFSRGFDVYADFTSVDGLETGANVRVSGLQAGELVEIQVPRNPAGQYRVKLRMDEKVHPLVRQDSIATIQTDGLVGDKFLEVDKGSDDSPPCPPGGTIPTMEPFDFSDLMQQGRGLLDNTNTTIKTAGDVADNVNRMLGQFLAKDRSGKNGPAELQETVASAQHAMSNISEDTEALKHNFLLRGFFHNRGYYDLSELTPAQYRTSKLVKGKLVKRQWVSSDQLFVKSPNGREQLSDKGRAALDNAMSAFVSDLPNRPLIVEGYSEQGPPDEQYRKSQQRAAAVQQYLEARFQLKPDLVGEIPLESSPPEASGRKDWDGVSLVLLP